MPIRQHWEFIWPSGIQITFLQWIETLSNEEQEEFRAAKTRQHEHRQKVIDEGRMTMPPGQHQVYEWRDQAAREQGKPNDPVWLKYWERYLRETQTQWVSRDIEI